MAETNKLRFIERVFNKSPVSPWWTGFLFAVFSIALLTLIELVNGRMPGILNPTLYERENYLLLVLHLLLLAYIPTAVVVLGQEAQRNARALSHLVTPSVDTKKRLALIGTYPKKWYFIWGLFGVVIGLLAPSMDADVWRDQIYDPMAFTAYSAETWAQRVLALFIGFYTGVLFFAAMAEGRRFSRLARYVTDEHVLDPQSLVPFTQQGLSNVLIVAGFPAIFALFVLNEGLIYMVIGIGIFAIAFAVVGLLWPLSGIHDRIKSAKLEQLNWVNTKLAEEKTKLRRGRDTHFSELMSYRTYIEAVREWPLDGSTVSRLAFYLAIPLLSWSGAALVERMIDSALS